MGRNYFACLLSKRVFVFSFGAVLSVVSKLQSKWKAHTHMSPNTCGFRFKHGSESHCFLRGRRTLTGRLHMDELGHGVDLGDQPDVPHHDPSDAMSVLLQLIPGNHTTRTRDSPLATLHEGNGRSGLDQRQAGSGPDLLRLLLAGDPTRGQTTSELDQKEEVNKPEEQEDGGIPGEVEVQSSTSEEMDEMEVNAEDQQTVNRSGGIFSLLGLIPNSSWFVPSPKKRPVEEDVEPRLPALNLRRGLSKIKRRNQLVQALAEARKLKARNLNNPPIRQLFSSATSKASRDSKRKTTITLLEALTGEGQALPMNPDLLMALASALKAGNYKAGEGYLVESKLMHIEAGFSWSEQLDRAFKQCKRALDRGKGPRKKALEVDFQMRSNPKKLTWEQSSKVVKFPGLLFTFAVNWMLRAIELAAVKTEHIILDYHKKKVALKLETSKMDQGGSGVMRTLQCLCKGSSCVAECPYKVALEILKRVENFNGTNSFICLTSTKGTPTKQQIIQAWRMLYGKAVTGHSARRSGALGYIRAGWTISQTAYLGRWKSSAILSYAEEALETMPANLADPSKAAFETMKDGPEGRNEVDILEYTSWKEMVSRELKAMKKDLENRSTELNETMDFWKIIAKTEEGQLPAKVSCRSSRVVHYNNARVAASPPCTWRSACGWAYYGGNFMFESNSVEITCVKCLNLHAEQRGGGGTS